MRSPTHLSVLEARPLAQSPAASVLCFLYQAHGLVVECAWMLIRSWSPSHNVTPSVTDPNQMTESARLEQTVLKRTTVVSHCDVSATKKRAKQSHML
eukprot:1284380-Rhodomonas_salina.1